MSTSSPSLAPITKSDLAWRMFATMATAEDERAAAFRGMVRSRLGLDQEQVRKVTAASAVFVATHAALQREVEAHIVSRYGTGRVASDTPRPGERQIAPSSRPVIRLPRGVTTLKEELRRTGYLEYVEQRQKAAIEELGQAMKRDLPAASYQRLEGLVTQEMADRIQLVGSPDPAGSTVLGARQRPQR